MSRATRPHRALLLFAGALVVTAGLVWAGGHRSPVDAKSAAPAPVVAVSAPAPVVAASAQARAAAIPPAVTAAAPSAQSAPPGVAGAAGMRIFKDPETGEIGPPNAAQSSTLETDANSEDMTGLRQEVLPDGSVMIDLQGRFQESMVVQMTPDGRRVTTCTRDVKKTLAHAPAQTPQREER